MLLPAVANAREPLPTVEVVDTPKRLRLSDVRMTFSVGAGYSQQYRSFVETGALDGTISFLQLTEATSLHLSLGEAAVTAPKAITPHPADRFEEQGFLSVDAGLGVTRVGPNKVAFSLSVMGGPRWSDDWLDMKGIVPNGRGGRVRAELFFAYTRLEDAYPRPHSEKWFRRYVLGGLHLWADARYDIVASQAGPSWAGGVGLDFVRAAMLPVFDVIDRN